MCWQKLEDPGFDRTRNKFNFAHTKIKYVDVIPMSMFIKVIYKDKFIISLRVYDTALRFSYILQPLTEAYPPEVSVYAMIPKSR